MSKQTKWISVKSELPELNAPVLIAGHQYGNKRRGRYFAVGVFNGADWVDGDDLNDEVRSFHTPTHWMPIPELPDKL